MQVALTAELDRLIDDHIVGACEAAWAGRPLCGHRPHALSSSWRGTNLSSIQRAGALKRCKVLHRSEEEIQMKHVGLPRHQIEIILPAAAI